MDNTGKLLISVCIGFGLIVGIEATRYVYENYIIPNRLAKESK